MRAPQEPEHLARQRFTVLVVDQTEVKGMSVTVTLQEVELGLFHIRRNGDMHIEPATQNKFFYGRALVRATVRAKLLGHFMEDVVYRYHGIAGPFSGLQIKII